MGYDRGLKTPCLSPASPQQPPVGTSCALRVALTRLSAREPRLLSFHPSSTAPQVRSSPPGWVVFSPTPQAQIFWPNYVS